MDAIYIEIDCDGVYCDACHMLDDLGLCHAFGQLIENDERCGECVGAQDYLDEMEAE